MTSIIHIYILLSLGFVKVRFSQQLVASAPVVTDVMQFILANKVSNLVLMVDFSDQFLRLSYCIL